MDSKKNHRKSIPFIRIDTSSMANNQNPFISSSSSEESLPVDAPLVRQTRCSADIDTISSVISEKSLTDGIEIIPYFYSENPDRQGSTQNIT